MLSNAYFLAKFRFDTAENEPAKNLQDFLQVLPKNFLKKRKKEKKVYGAGDVRGPRRPEGRRLGARGDLLHPPLRAPALRALEPGAGPDCGGEDVPLRGCRP